MPKEILERNIKRASEKGQEAYIEKTYEVAFILYVSSSPCLIFCVLHVYLHFHASFMFTTSMDVTSSELFACYI